MNFFNISIYLFLLRLEMSQIAKPAETDFEQSMLSMFDWCQKLNRTC